MKGKYVIQNEVTNKWISLNMEGDTIIYVDSFEFAYKFRDYEQSLEFKNTHKLNSDFKLFKLQILAHNVGF